MLKSKPQSLHLYDMQGSLPSYNIKATIVPCKGTGVVFLYGGFDDSDQLDGNVYLLNVKTKTWEVDDKHEGIYRDGHSAVYIGNGNVLIFGGVPYDEEFADTISNRRHHSPTFNKNSIMMIYNIFNKKWIGPPQFALSNAPTARSRHASCLSADGSKIYISGGLAKSSSGDVPLDDLYCYDLTNGTWDGPIRFVSRFDHYIKIHGDKLYSFGGLDRDMNHVKNTVSFYSFKTRIVGDFTIHSTFDPYSPFSEQTHFPDEERLFLDSGINSSLTLKLFLPPWNSNIPGLHIEDFSVDDFETFKVFDIENFKAYFNMKFINIMSYSWKMGFVNADEGCLYLFGNHFRDQQTIVELPDILDLKLTTLLKINLSSLGIPSLNQKVTSSSIKNTQLSSDFTRILLEEEFTDFEIYAFKNENDRTDDETMKYYDSHDIDNLERSGELEVIKVHKAVLIARWPHFQRMISSGMNEQVRNKLLIPEPYNWIKGLIYYLYSGSIEFGNYIDSNYTILDYMGLLILSNLYNLPELRELSLFHMYRGFEDLQLNFARDNENDSTIQVLLKLWKQISYESLEPIFLMKVIELIKSNWSTITRSSSFLGLSKPDIIKLCQDSSDEVISKSDSNLATPESSHESLEHDGFSDELQTPARVGNSPFVIDSVALNHRQSDSFSSLQHLTGVLNDNIQTRDI